MAVSQWLMRKSFSEASKKADQIRRDSEAKKARNSGLFTGAQENLRRELGLHDRKKKLPANHECCDCTISLIAIKPSRARVRIQIKRK
ncbi:unannotated protein [freshwater metagenome]|jgi:hypothetical protein|uniref:Unannotated protein n=1 Tax=freshwater metagenome TaxID=449393 RepID=A0A6J7M9Q2_9ZZZZ|nr:hypothetical protein [Actinomycetota bacterium]MSW57984.1 hypothetical protein [Actinomycetota bacterium]MTA67000.1 hypothetical protein [Actinomycetota bacterium]MTB15853.1 hypothetical protein [Actinomycetota bacterium]